MTSLFLILCDPTNSFLENISSFNDELILQVCHPNSRANGQISVRTINYTSTMWNTVEYCRDFEDMKAEISSSLKSF